MVSLRPEQHPQYRTFLTGDRSLVQEIFVPVKEGLSIDEAEKIIANLQANPDSNVVLDLTICQHVDAGAGFRIVNAISRYRQSATQSFVVRLPELATGAAVSKLPYFYSVYLRSGLGVGIAQYATSIQAQNREVTRQFSDYFLKLAAPNIQRGANVYVIRSLTGSHIDSTAESSLYTKHIQPAFEHLKLSTRATEGNDVQNVGALLWQAVQNVIDHAAQAPFPAGTAMESYMSFTRYKTLSASPGDFKGYLARLKEQRHRLSLPPEFFLEITVSDNGVGIPARHSQDAQIYHCSIEQEIEALLRALAPGQSIKNRIFGDSYIGTRGFGYTIIPQSLARLKAYGVLRTGRCALTFDGTLQGPHQFSLEQSGLGLMPGTALHLIVPAHHNLVSNQLELAFDDISRQ